MRQYQDLIVDFGGRDVTIQQPEPEETSTSHSLGLRARDRFSRFLFLKQMFGAQTGQQETNCRRHSDPSKEHESGGLRCQSSSVPKQLSSTRSITRGTKTSSRSSVGRRQNALFNSMISTGSTESGRTESSNTEMSIKSSWGEREELRKSQQGPNPFGFF